MSVKEVKPKPEPPESGVQFLAGASRWQRTQTRKTSSSNHPFKNVTTQILAKGRKMAHKSRSGELAMKINEDWLSVIIAFALMLLALVGVITPTLVTF
jgi:hypothetical protein